MDWQPFATPPETVDTPEAAVLTTPAPALYSTRNSDELETMLAASLAERRKGAVLK